MDWFERHWGVRWMAFARTMAVAACLCPALLHAADVGYDYDEAGRLVQVRTAAGSAQYRYDLAGNLIAVERSAAGAVSLAEIAPNRGPVGTLVTLLGSGFAASPAGNVVRFNGVVASVVSASPARLTVSVPAGATSGPVSVTVAGNTATLADGFAVTASAVDAPPIVTNPATSLTLAGSLVTLSGSGFGSSVEDVWVRVNGLNATVVSVSPTEVTFSVPLTATSGVVAVGTRQGSVTEAGTLFIPPTGSGESDIGATAVLAIDGSPQGFSLPAEKRGLFTFSGQVGQTLGLGISSVTTSPADGGLSISVLNPDGSTLVTCPSAASAGAGCELPALPRSGFYTVFVTASSGESAEFVLTLSQDIQRTLAFNGPAQSVVIERAGQNARYSFVATTSQAVFELLDSSFSSVTLTLKDTYGSTHTRTTVAGATAHMSVSGLVAGRRYHLGVSPLNALTGQVSMRVGLPDLVVGGLSVGALRMTPEGAWVVPVSFTVSNTGGVSAQSAWYDVAYLSSDAVLDDGDQSNDVLASRGTLLAPGASYAVAAEFVTTTATPIGNYTLFVKADGNNITFGGSNTDSGTVGESNESNNLASAAISLTRPDLVASNLSVGTLSRSEDGSWVIPVTYTVTNVSTTAAPPIWTDIAYLSTDVLLDNSDASSDPLAWRVTALAAGASSTVTSTFTTSAATPPGSYTLFVKADGHSPWSTGGSNTDGGDILEANENNNAVSRAINLRAADLAISNVSVGTATADPDGLWSVPVTYTVTNIGGVPTSAAWYDTAYLSTNATLDDADPSAAPLNWRGASLAPGQSYTVTIPWVTDAPLSPGNYTLFVKTDGHNVDHTGGSNTDSGEVAETNETNNTTGMAIALGSTGPEGEVPLPAWALLVLGGLLFSAMRRHKVTTH